MDLPLKVRIYPIFYILLLENVINVNLIKKGRNDINVKKKRI